MRPFFIGLSVALGFSINPLVLAQSAGPAIQALIQNFKLQRKDISQIIDLLLSSNKISPNQAIDAKARLKGMTDSEIKSLSMEAFSNVHPGKSLFADTVDVDLDKGNDKDKGKQVSNDIKLKDKARGPASLPASPFFSVEEFKVETPDETRERKRLEQAQQNIMKNVFKKYQ
jgi:hypothetical protein